LFPDYTNWKKLLSDEAIKFVHGVNLSTENDRPVSEDGSDDVEMAFDQSVEGVEGTTTMK
jgi:hypothetical protein